MGKPAIPSPAMLVIAASSRYDEALAWGLQKAEREFGVAGAVSDAFDFNETKYYESEMGLGLKKQFWAFADLIDPGRMAAIKRATNAWEAECADGGRHPEPRPLNLDPGYLTLAKLVLASTKDHAHRVYLGDGIYAEVTLSFRRGVWRTFEWTYPDYQRGDYHEFFAQCRQRLLDAPR